MSTITLTVTDDAATRLRKVALSRGFGSIEEYLQHLLNEDLRRADQQRLEAVLLERLDSGLSVEMDDEDFRRIREEVAARIARQKAS
jgi:antitoxin ParD1/3/4